MATYKVQYQKKGTNGVITAVVVAKSKAEARARFNQGHSPAIYKILAIYE